MPSEFSVINVMTINNWEVVMTARLQHPMGPWAACFCHPLSPLGCCLPLHWVPHPVHSTAQVRAGPVWRQLGRGDKALPRARGQGAGHPQLLGPSPCRAEPTEEGTRSAPSVPERPPGKDMGPALSQLPSEPHPGVGERMGHCALSQPL